MHRCKVNSDPASASYYASKPAVLSGPSWPEEAVQLLLSSSMQNYNFHQQLVLRWADLCAAVPLWSSVAAAQCRVCLGDAAFCRAALAVSFHWASQSAFAFAGVGGSERGCSEESRAGPLLALHFPGWFQWRGVGMGLVLRPGWLPRERWKLWGKAAL